MKKTFSVLVFFLLFLNFFHFSQSLHKYFIISSLDENNENANLQIKGKYKNLGKSIIKNKKKQNKQKAYTKGIFFSIISLNNQIKKKDSRLVDCHLQIFCTINFIWIQLYFKNFFS